MPREVPTGTLRPTPRRQRLALVNLSRSTGKRLTVALALTLRATRQEPPRTERRARLGTRPTYGVKRVKEYKVL